MGNVGAGDFEVNFSCRIAAPTSELNLIIRIEWGEIASPQRQLARFFVQALAQASDVRWSELEYMSPYSTAVAEGDAFVGREDRVRLLAAKILRSPMEPFYITGQRRVGKTSLAKASAALAQQKVTQFHLHVHYVLWGSVAAVDPSASLRRLGESIHEFIADAIREEVQVDHGDYMGSLADLLRLSLVAFEADPNRRFLVILDEIDELPSQLYVSGDLASTFFGNLRALSRASNIGLIFVGGENMPYLMDRQGQRLNNFSRVNLTSYDRGSEWRDFCLLVQEPTRNLLNWHEEAISEVPLMHMAPVRSTCCR